MSRRVEPEPPFTVKQRVDLTLRADQVEHAIRYWLLNNTRVPQAKSFSDIVVRVFATEEGTALSATLTYEPVPTPARQDSEQPAKGEGE